MPIRNLFEKFRAFLSFLLEKEKKGFGCSVFFGLDFLLAECGSEGFAATFAQADGEFCSFACFVWSSGHLPGFLWLHFFSTFWTFCHEFASMNVIV